MKTRKGSSIVETNISIPQKVRLGPMFCWERYLGVQVIKFPSEIDLIAANYRVKASTHISLKMKAPAILARTPLKIAARFNRSSTKIRALKL